MASAAAPAEAPTRPFQCVLAATPAGGIGLEGGLPWRLPGEMAFFRDLTTKTRDAAKRNAVLMGRKTWDSLPPKFKPLPGRLNVVLSASGAVSEAGSGGAGELPAGVLVARSLPAALSLLSSPPHASSVETVFVAGGAAVYAEALSAPGCEAVHLTEVALTPEPRCDAFVPPLDPARFALYAASPPQRAPDGAGRYTFLTYVARPPAKAKDAVSAAPLPPLPALPPGVRGRHEELQYLEMIAHIIDCGEERTDRTGTGTLSVFGRQMRFDLRRSFPLLTTKRVFWRGVAEELLWFVKGSTNAALLRDKDIHIWDGNGSRAFLDASGLGHREEWDLGPVYGFQWRHFGAEYTDMHADYTGKGVDQLAEVIDKLKNNPTDRRILMTAWNPAALREMALPPCHMFAQFYVAAGELSCLMYQRSCDMGLGVPFNIASYALLTRLLAQVTGLKPGELVHTLGDAHVYSNHVDALRTQLERQPRAFPTLRINPAVKDIDGFCFADFELADYECHAPIKMKMAV